MPSVLAEMVVVVELAEPNVTVPGPETCVQSTDATPEVASEALPIWVKEVFVVTLEPAEAVGLVLSILT